MIVIATEGKALLLVEKLGATEARIYDPDHSTPLSPSRPIEVILKFDPYWDFLDEPYAQEETPAEKVRRLLPEVLKFNEADWVRNRGRFADFIGRGNRGGGGAGSSGAGEPGDPLKFDPVWISRAASIQQQLVPHYADWAATVTPAEREALIDYGRDKSRMAAAASGEINYREINAQLRNPGELQRDMERFSRMPEPARNKFMSARQERHVKTQERIDLIDSALARASSPEMIAYRGFGFEGRNMAVGDTFLDRGFTSTSANIVNAADFGEGNVPKVGEIRIPKGSRAVALNAVINPSGDPATHVPGTRNEAEVLIDRGGVYRVVGQRRETIEYDTPAGERKSQEVDILEIEMVNDAGDVPQLGESERARRGRRYDRFTWSDDDVVMLSDEQTEKFIESDWVRRLGQFAKYIGGGGQSGGGSYAKDKTVVDFSKIADPDTRKAMEGHVADLLRDYPALDGYVDTVTAAPIPFVGYWTRSRAGIVLDPDSFTDTGLARLAGLASQGEFQRGMAIDPIKSAVNHEFGHVVRDKLIGQAVGGGLNMARQPDLDPGSLYSQTQGIPRAGGKYALENDNENFAEAFAEMRVVPREDWSPAAKAMDSLIQRGLAEGALKTKAQKGWQAARVVRDPWGEVHFRDEEPPVEKVRRLLPDTLKFVESDWVRNSGRFADFVGQSGGGGGGSGGSSGATTDFAKRLFDVEYDRDTRAKVVAQIKSEAKYDPSTWEKNDIYNRPASELSQFGFTVRSTETFGQSGTFGSGQVVASNLTSRDGTIHINAEAWDSQDAFGRETLLHHELGHNAARVMLADGSGQKVMGFYPNNGKAQLNYEVRPFGDNANFEEQLADASGDTTRSKGLVMTGIPNEYDKFAGPRDLDSEGGRNRARVYANVTAVNEALGYNINPQTREAVDRYRAMEGYGETWPG